MVHIQMVYFPCSYFVKNIKDMKTEHITYQNETFKKKDYHQQQKRAMVITGLYSPLFLEFFYIQKWSGNVLCMSLFNEKTCYTDSLEKVWARHSSNALKLIDTV